ncbi:MAG: excinuclease ABC subunit UvrB [Ureaplasma sp.]|nr:excinuclease ABC subunit UvrB [Ureaplasma sp.]
MKKRFELSSKMSPSGDQGEAIKQLSNNINNNIKSQVLLGATGTGKTFTIANVIQNTQKKTLVMAHNKTLAAQLYMELKEFFPNNKVEFFISYFDYYQPEAYVASKDLYIEKSSLTNKEIEKMRISTLNSLATSDDVIVVASVAAIYASVSRADFLEFSFNIEKNQIISPKKIREKLVMLNYTNNDVNLKCGTFRNKGDVLDIAPGYDDSYFIRISFFGDEIEKILKVDSLNLHIIEELESFNITSANEYVINRNKLDVAIEEINKEKDERAKFFYKQNKFVEAQRIEQRTNYDIEAIKEFGYCAGIENYARFLEHRPPGSTPYTIFDFFDNKDGWLLIMDESHISVPQIRGMYNTDRSRKESLVNYGFRLPSALDNRPLMFDEFLDKISHSIFVSATPNDWEIQYSNDIVIEQIVRPTGLLDPIIELKSSTNQVDDILIQINRQIEKKERTFINVMTIKMAEELSKYLQEKQIKAAYMHNELKTLERTKVINDLRKGVYDVVIGINLLREGLDVPEVSLVLILDADKPGFFRSEKSLIQIIGRAARNANGKVIMYGDEMTEAMQIAITETARRRKIQEEYNKKHNIIPQTIIKPIREEFNNSNYKEILEAKNPDKENIQKTIRQLKKQMLDHAKEQEYEKAAEVRDLIFDLEIKLEQLKK